MSGVADEHHPARSPPIPLDLVDRAEVHVGIGEHAEALNRLEEAHAERAADLAWLNVRPVFASLRDEPRFAALLNAMRLSPSSPVAD